MVLKEKARDLPKKPGVYIMKDSLNNIIYIGKSKSLKNRVSQYFQSSKNHTNKTIKMINNIDSFDYIVTDTELDALLLECKLIKLYKPMFNKLMKNKMSYPYLKLTTSEEYPALTITYEEENDKDTLFGPYTSLSMAEKVISFIYNQYPIRRCSTQTLNRDSSGCLNYHLGKCMGSCRSDVDKKLYRSYIEKITTLLSGNNSSIVKEIEEKMKIASEKLDYQKAAKYRDDLQLAKHIIYKEKAKRNVERRKNIIAIESIDEDRFKLFLIRGNKVIYTEVYEIRESNKKKNMTNIIKGLVYRYFSTEDTASVKVTREDIDESHIIYSYLKNKRKSIKSIVVPKAWIAETNESKLKTGLEKIVNELA